MTITEFEYEMQTENNHKVIKFTNYQEWFIRKCFICLTNDVCYSIALILWGESSTI